VLRSMNKLSERALRSGDVIETMAGASGVRDYQME
jgi:hypothetical protein